MRKIYLLLPLIILLSIPVMGQQMPQINHYFLMPNVYNPAYIGKNDVIEIDIIHRQQWIGIEGAPVTTFIGAQAPVSNHFSFGLSFLNDRSGLLTTNTALASGVYSIPFKREGGIRFGLSLGINSNSVDIKDDFIDDPALMDAGLNSIGLEGQFGINASFLGFDLGFAVPTVFSSGLVENEDNTIGIDDITTTVSSLAYRFNVGMNLAITPQFIYKTYTDLDNQYEGNVTLFIKDIMWLGGGYRENYGGMAHLGFNIKNRFSFGYSYEIASDQVSGYTNGTHEFMIRLQIPKVSVKDNRQEDVIATLDETPVLDTIPVDEPHLEIPEEAAVVAGPVAAAETNEVKTILEDSEAKHIVASEPGNFKSGFYVVVGAFMVPNNAKSYSRELNSSGYESHVGYSSITRLHYVYTYRSNDLNGARSERDRFRSIDRYSFPESWVLALGPEEDLQIDPDGNLFFEKAPVDQDPVIKINATETLSPGFYIVANSFLVENNASTFKQRLKNQGNTSDIGFSKETGLYYVYVNRLKSYEEAKDLLNFYKNSQNKDLRGAQILSVR